MPLPGVVQVRDQEAHLLGAENELAAGTVALVVLAGGVVVACLAQRGERGAVATALRQAVPAVAELVRARRQPRVVAIAQLGRGMRDQRDVSEWIRSPLCSTSSSAVPSRGIGAAETAATRIAHYQPVLIPGIVQTAEYARELLRLPSGPAESGASDEEINRMIASRLRRQAILYEPGRSITVLMGEGALRTNVASHATMHAQREHIARLAETLTTATIAIIPFTARAPIATLHGWSLTDDLATIETDAGNLEIADPEHVERYWHHTRLLLDAATTDSAAAALCRRVTDHNSSATPDR